VSAVKDPRRARPRDTSSLSTPHALEFFRHAVAIRDDWLSAGLSVRPADRTTAEAAVTELYQLIAEPKPSFEWLPSPAAAFAAGPGRGLGPVRLQAASAWPSGRDWPVAARLASLLSRLRRRLDARIGRRTSGEWPGRGVVTARRAAPEDALMLGASLADVLEVAVHDSLRTTLRDAMTAPLRAALARMAADSPGLAWYGQHDAYWVAHYDAWRRLGLVTYHPDDDDQLDLWVAVARSAGWWWPGEGRCVMTGRPSAVRSEPLPGRWHGELRLHRPDGPAISYPDGFGLYALHGTPVPAWVLTGPSAELISREPNVEVRRSAIERLGWEAYIERAGLTLVARRADPGNPGSDLCLYDLPGPAWGTSARVLVVVNGTPEPDGQRRRYGLSVPAGIDNPIAAAGWSYGLTADQYARLARRT
jgi:hypothetical protein